MSVYIAAYGRKQSENRYTSVGEFKMYTGCLVYNSIIIINNHIPAHGPLAEGYCTTRSRSEQ